MVPARFTEVEMFHHTPSGKIDRKQTPSVRQERGAGAERGPGATAHSVTSLWEDVLEIREPDPDAAFSELGGNSLLLLQLVSRLDKKFSQEVASNFDQKMSIRDLVALIEDQSASAQRERPHAGG
jgi:acyl carrier protein